jgi:hypothetical protein
MTIRKLKTALLYFYHRLRNIRLNKFAKMVDAPGIIFDQIELEAI